MSYDKRQWRRQRAIDFMLNDAKHACGIGGQSEQTPEEKTLTDGIMDIVNDPATPIRVVEALGMIVSQAHQIGYRAGWGNAASLLKQQRDAVVP